jgi:AraC family L-rhamnose operon regulatory protein RhaS
MKRRRPAEVIFPRSGICALESRHADDFQMDWTRHPFPKILFAREGSGFLLTEKTKYRLQSGRIALIPKGLRHRILDTPQDPLSVYILCLRTPLVVTLLQEGGLNFCRVIGHAALGGAARRLFREILYEQTLDRPGAVPRVIGLVLELVGFLMRWQDGRAEPAVLKTKGKSLSRARVTAVIQSVENQFYRPQGLEEAAARAELRPRRFSQLFHRTTGKSWPAFLRGKRIDHAKRLLARTDRSLAAICFECGFEDLSTFYRAFHKTEATTPKKWREKARSHRRDETATLRPALSNGTRN